VPAATSGRLRAVKRNVSNTAVVYPTNARAAVIERPTNLTRAKIEVAQREATSPAIILRVPEPLDHPLPNLWRHAGSRRNVGHPRQVAVKWRREGQMAIAKRLGWVFIGIVIGWIGSGSLVAARWAQGTAPRRLMVVSGGKLSEGVNGNFIKDTMTGACWLSIPSRDDMSRALAPAPKESCQQ